MENNITNRLATLRAEMKKYNIDAWYISGTDPNNNEYLPERWKTRAFISGFTGSYGMVVVTQDQAALWTDTRYFLQAEEQLRGTGIEMQKLRVPNAVSPEKWMSEKLEKGSKVGIDLQTVSVDVYRNFKSVLAEKEIEIVETPDFFETIWEDRPLIPDNEIFELTTEFSGLSRKEKQKLVAAKLNAKGAGLQGVSMLDELAWLLNLRGSDISYNPLFIGFGLVGENENYLFTSVKRIPGKLLAILENDGVTVKEISMFYPFLKELKNKNILLDTATANYSIYRSLAKYNEIVEGTSVVSHLKALKNKVEIEGFKNAMKKDGVALVEFHFWLKSNIGKTEMTEFTIGRKLAEFRSKQKDFKGESFPPIVGYKSHGALVHLTVGPENALPVEKDGILLFDSGGQYPDGTTDITRTVALSGVSEKVKKDFTLVLKGMIGLTLAKFPAGTLGYHLDILARKPLWENGLNYGHGTGHGVGHFLNVHEGPMAIRQEFNPNPIEEGMVMSNEPAFYREGEYGIRTENMMVCVEKDTTEFGRFLGFETLTLCPIDTSLLLTELLNGEEREWINQYHKKVNTELKPLLSAEYHKFLNELTREI